MSSGLKVGLALIKIAKSGNTKAFLEFIERNQVLTSLPKLSAIDTSQLIYSFSTLRIHDKRIWAGLEGSFLSKQQSMNIHDMVMCAGAFGRNTKNPEIWKAIEKYLTANKDYIEMRSIVTVTHAFAHADYKSDPLWKMLEERSLIDLSKCSQKELAIITWGFSHVEKGSTEFWDKLEEIIIPKIQTFTLQNLAIIAYGFSKLRKGKERFWNAIEKSTIAVLLSSSDRIDRFKIQDLGNLVWAFANLGLGGESYWNNIEKAAIRNMHRYKMIDFANQSWSFLYSKHNPKEFWQSMVTQLKKIDTFDERTIHRDLVLVGAALGQKNIKDKFLWESFSKKFSKLLKTGALDTQMGRARFHKVFYEADPTLWDKEVEEIYLKNLDACQDNTRILVQNLMNICSGAYPNLGSEQFWEHALGLFLTALKSKKVLVENEEIRNRVAQIIYLFHSKLEFNKNKALQQKLDEELDQFYSDEEIFLKMTQENKITLMVQLKAFVLRKLHFHNRKFWHYLVINRNKFNSQFDFNDIRNLMFTIIIKNGLFFKPSQYDDYNATVNELYGNCSDEQIKEMTDFLFDVLLTRHKTHDQLFEHLLKNEMISKMPLKNFLDSTDSKSSQGNKSQVHGEYAYMYQEYENKKAPETQGSYIDD